jgi:hypothetical protein
MDLRRLFQAAFVIQKIKSRYRKIKQKEASVSTRDVKALALHK